MLDHLQRRIHGPYRMIGLFLRGPKNDHQAVADVLVYDPAVGFDHRHHHAKVCIQQADDFVGRAMLRKTGEISNIAKKNGNRSIVAP